MMDSAGLIVRLDRFSSTQLFVFIFINVAYASQVKKISNYKQLINLFTNSQNQKRHGC